MTEDIERFAHKRSKRLAGKLERQVRRAARKPDQDAMHDLRVAIRRLSQCLEEFHQFFPLASRKRRWRG